MEVPDRRYEGPLDLFLRKFPRAYHVSLCPNPETVIEYGLFSPHGLLQEIGAVRYADMLRSQRSDILSIATSWGTVYVNDQRPMSRSALMKCLEGVTPEDWYLELNQRIFFFLREEAARRFASVRQRVLPRRTVFVVNTEKMLSRCDRQFELSPINSGAALRKPVRRSRNTFQPVERYPLQQRARTRGWSHAVAELTIKTDRLPIDSFLESYYSV